jgi:hypothetical protein
MIVLLNWHPTEQAWSAFGRILVDRNVDRSSSTRGQRAWRIRGRIGVASLLSVPRYSLASLWTCSMTALWGSVSGRRSWRLISA